MFTEIFFWGRLARIKTERRFQMKKIVTIVLFAALGLVFENVTAIEKGIVVVGLGFDDDGKGKFIDGITQPGDVVVRSQGAGVAGHHANVENEVYELHHIPVGILRKDVKCYLAGGMVLDVPLLFQEIKELEKKGLIDIKDRLRISTSVHLLLPYHKKMDKCASVAGHVRASSIARYGVRACSAEKRFGIGIRLADLFSKDFPNLLKKAVDRSNDIITKVYGGEPILYKPLLEDYKKYAKELMPYVRDQVELKLNRLLAQKRGGPRVIFEGSHGTFLDVSHGNYPYVSAGSTIASGICAEAGVGPTRIGHTVGVVKAYATRVGDGPFPTEIKDQKIVSIIQNKAKRKCPAGVKVRFGWVDAVMVRQGAMINGVNSIVITRLDDLDDCDEIKMCIHYKLGDKDFDYLPPISRDIERVIAHYITFPGWKCSIGKAKKFSELPPEARDFVKKLERVCGVPVSYISVGPEREQLIEVVANLLPEGITPPAQQKWSKSSAQQKFVVKTP
jgi:adenylosuccinate synthase